MSTFSNLLSLSFLLSVSAISIVVGTGIREENLAQSPKRHGAESPVSPDSVIISNFPEGALTEGASELRELRTESGKFFLNPDGTQTAVIGAGPVHYQEDGEWKTILAQLLPNKSGRHPDRAYAAVHNRHKVYIPDSPGKSVMSVLDGQTYQDWGQPTLVWLDANDNVLSEVSSNRGTAGSVNEDMILFEDVFPGVGAEIRNSVTSKKLSYLLRDATVIEQRPDGAVYLAFREQVTAAPGWRLTEKETGKVAPPSDSSKRIYQALRFSSAEGTPMIDVERPIYFDRLADGDCAGTADTMKRNADSHIAGDFAVEPLGNNVFHVYTRVPVEWLAAEWRRFPLTIDPVTNYYPPAASGSVWPTYTANRSGNSGNWQCFAGTYAGRANVYDISYGWVDDSWPFSNPYMDGYATFDITGVPDNAFINSATNHWYRYGGRTCGDAIRLKHGMVQNNENLSIQADCNIDGNRVRNNNSYYNGTGKNDPNGWKNQAANTADVANALAGNRITMGWAYNGGDDCCTGCVFGICACTGNDGAYHHVYGYQNSTYRPYIAINYCERPTITAQPADRNICTSATMTAISVTATGTALTFQWQVSNNTACSGAANWQNITGATSASFTPPKIAGTRLYRVIVTASDCNAGTSGMTVTSNCSRVTVNAMNGSATGVPGGFPAPHGTGDSPPPIQFANCGGLVLPGSNHIMGTLQPPAIGAVNSITSYTWTATGGSFTGSGSSVTWNAPATTGMYTITVTYGTTSCGTFQSSCNVEVGQPNCDFAYVRPAASGGVDAVDKGGPDNPYATLAYAINQLGGRTHIRLANGSYTETQRVNIPSNVIIEGRYDAANGWRKQNNGNTSLTFTNVAGNISTSGDSRHLIGMAAITSGWTLQDINVTTSAVTGTHNSRGSSNYALWLNGASNYNIIRCQFTAGAASQGSAGNSPAAATLRNNGSNGSAGHCDNNNSSGCPGSGVCGGAGGAAVGAVGRLGGAGGAGGRGSANNSNNHAAGSNGSSGGGGAAGGTCGGGVGASGGCGTDCNRDGRAGCNGANGSDGANASTTPPAANNNFATYWVPNGQSSNGSDGQGGGGGKGGGGGGRQNGTFCDDGPGSGGGGGGSGGQGGQAGTGGWGGGGSFAIYRNNSSTDANIVNVVTSIPGSAASGGAGGTGSNGAPGGIGACGDGTRCNTCTGSGNCMSGSRVCNDCQVGAGGRGGNGGNGGRGGNGQPGANGRNEHMVTVVSGTPTITNHSTSIPTSPEIRVLHDKGKPCINSEINLYKASGTWTLPTGLTFVNDRNETAGGTSYTSATQDIKVYTSTVSATYNLTAPADFPGFLRTAADIRPLPNTTVVPNSLCVGPGAEIQLTHTNPWNTQVDYEWVIFSATGNDANTALLTSTLNNPLVDVSSLAAGNYKVRYRVKEICCGWSRPVYINFTITPQPTQPNNLSKTAGSNHAQVCEGATALSVNAASGSTGGAGTCVYEYSYQNTDGNWSDWQTGIPSITAGAAPGFVRIKARRNCNGVACNESSETPAVEWEVVEQPEAGAVSRSTPVEQTVCVGQSLTPAVSGGSGGISSTDEIQWRKGTTGGWNNYTGAINTTTHGAGEYYFRTRRVSSGYGCTASDWLPAGNGSLLWLVYDVPVAPAITRDPADATVCVGASLSVTVTAFGSGGPSGCEDQIRYSTNAGTTWSAWGTAVPTASTVPVGTTIFESRRYCDGSLGCTSNTNSVSWTVVADPTVSTQPSGTALCAGQSHTLTMAIAGGAGLGYQWQYFNGSIWTPVTAGQPATGFSYASATTASMTVNTTTATPFGTNYRFRCSVSSGPGCNPNPLITSEVTITVVPAVINAGFRTWTGMVDTDWDKPLNWDCGGVPISTTNVWIPATTTTSNYPVIVNGQVANCRTIELLGNAPPDRMTIQTGGTLNVFSP